jgi:hypothetical protein
MATTAATEALKRFMVERLLDLDPRLNDEAGSDIYSKVIDPLMSRLGVDPMSVDMETFILTRLRDEFPDLDVNTPGSVLRDILVAPLVLLLEPVRREIEFLKTQQSIARWEALTEEELDAILSNLFASRQTGAYAYGVVRVFMKAPQTFSVDASIGFSTTDGIAFRPEYPETFFSDQFQRSGSLYYIDIAVQSIYQDAIANVPKDSVKFVDGLSGVIRVTNPNAMSGGVTKETNEDFLNRAERSLSERSLNTKRGIETNLFNNFDDIVSVEVIGFGEPEMQRDILQGEVNVDLTEVPGPLIFMSANWSTMNLVDNIPVPFTNIFYVNPPAAGWDPELLSQVKAAKYARFADGHRNFSDPILGRVRVIDLSFHDNIDDRVYFKLADFDAYPQSPSPFTAITPAEVSTTGEFFGLNAHPSQGSDYKLYGAKDNAEYVRGSHIPFSDYLGTDFNSALIPRGVIRGRDFLLVSSKSVGAVDAGHTFSKNPAFNANADNLYVDHPAKFRMYPLTKFFKSTELGIGRVDGLLTSKDRVVYKGQGSFEFVPDLTYSGLYEETHIVDFGGPAKLSVEDRYDGVTIEEFGRNAGVLIEAKIDGQSGSYSVPDPTNHPMIGAGDPAYPVDLVLHPSTKSWAERRVENGHFVSCSVYKEGFDGKTNLVDENLLWTGWGKVIGTGYGDPSRLRVQGMDFLPLHKHNMAGWSPGASGSITIDEVPLALAGPSGMGNNYNDRLLTFNYANTSVPFADTFELSTFSQMTGSARPSIAIELAESRLAPLWVPTTASGKLVFRIRINGEIVFSFDGAFGSEDNAVPLLTSWGTAIDAPSTALAGTGIEDMDPSVALAAPCSHQLAGMGQCSCQALHFLKIIHMGLFQAMLDAGNQTNLPYELEPMGPLDGSGNITTGSLLWDEASQSGRVVIYDRRYHEEGNGISVVLERYDPDPANAIPVNSNDPNDYAGSTLLIEGAHPDAGSELFLLVDQSLSGATEFTGGVNPLPSGVADELANQIENVPVTQRFYANISLTDNATINMTAVEPGDEYNATDMSWETAAAVNGPEISTSTWNNLPQLNGGFWGGFGPLAQVVGREDANTMLDFVNEPATAHAFNTLDSAGYETLTPELPLTGAQTRLLSRLENAPVAHPRHVGDASDIYQVRIIVEYTYDPQDGNPVEDRRAIYEDNGSGIFVESPENADLSTNGWLDLSIDSEINYASGQILLHFNGANALPSDTRVFAAYTYYSTPYKAYWTVYRGQRELVTPEGYLVPSYDDFAFAPAYKRPASYVDPLTALTLSGAVHARSTSGYRGDGWQSGDFESGDAGTGDFSLISSGDTYGTATKTAQLPAHSTHNNYFDCLWIRLNKGFDFIHPSLGSAPSSACTASEFVDLGGLGFEVSWPQPRYSQKRYETHISAGSTNPLDLDGDGATDKTVIQTICLPFAEGSNSVKHPEDDDAITLSTGFSGLPNVKSSEGFLLPHPMGANYAGGSFANVPLAGTEYQNSDLLEHQVCQLYSAMEGTVGDETITISGIPGGVPLGLGLFSPVEVPSDSVHIGGLTDIYLKPGDTEEETSGEIKMQPSDTSVGLEVVIYGDDGSINPAAEGSHFTSLSLAAALTTELEQTAPAPANNLVLEIMFPPSEEITPVFSRIVSSLADGCRIDGEFPESLGAGFTNLKFRVLRTCTTSLEDPLVILQQGNDLVTNKNEMAAFSPGGFDIPVDIAASGVYLSIDSNTNRGEYKISGQNLNTILLDKAMEETASGLDYRVYMRQAEKVQMPLVRIKEVLLSEDSSGIKVPYKHPVDIVSSSFAGLNDDPLTESSFGREGGRLSVVPHPVTGENVCVFDIVEEPAPNEEQTDFRKQGVVVYDVLVLEDLDGDLKYFYVTGFDSVELDGTNPNDATNNRLILDRAEPLPPGGYSELKFTVGHPAIGTGRVFFSERTYMSCGPETVFSYEDPETKQLRYMRPSPAESAVVYEGDKLFSDIRVYGSPDSNKLVSDTADFFKHGILPGDKLEVIAKVLMSEDFDGSAALMEHENLNVAGKTMVVRINSLDQSTTRTVTFGGPNPRSIDNVVSDINNQLGDVLRAEVYTSDDAQPYYKLRLYSGYDLEILTSGSIGILSDLRLTELDTTPTTSPASQLIVDCYVSHLDYVPESALPAGELAKTIIYLEDENGAPFSIPYMSGVPATEFETLFIKVSRPMYQAVFPGDLEEDERGLFYTDIKLTTFEPNDAEGVIAEDASLTAENYTSLGYEILTENNNYTYSLGEVSSIKTSGIVLGEFASSFEDVYEVAGARVTIRYDRSQTVSDVQAYMLQPSARVVCNNPLVRHFFPAYPMMSVNYGGNVTEERVREKVGDFLTTIYPNSPLTIYDLQTALTRDGVTYLRLPQEVAMLVYDKDRKRRLVRDTNIVTLGPQFHYMAEVDGITATKVR